MIHSEKNRRKCIKIDE